MASLSHPQLSDFYTPIACIKEASSNTNSSSNIAHHMQGLYSLMHSLHPKYPHEAAAPPPSHHADHYNMNAAKPFYYSSSVRGMSGGRSIGVEVEEPSFLSTVTSTSLDDYQVSSQLHLHPHKQAAMECKTPLKKRIRAVMECKEADTKKRMKLNTCETYQHRKTGNVLADVKPVIANADKLKAFSPISRKNSIITEQKSPESKSNITKASSSLDQESPSKLDFIHVRARRGQATDSHSLAERVRREKISERMKYLQDLVPSCIKVTGKAMMLDEIINYVQSLQRQVEFLSMKLAAVPPSRLEFSFDDLFGKTAAAQPSHANVPNTTSILGSDSVAVPATFTAPSTDYANNVQSGFVNSILRSNEMFPESVRSHDVNSSIQLTSNPEMMSMACSVADQFFANLPSDLGVEDPLVHHSAAGSSSCSLVASPTTTVLDPVQQSCISQQSSQLELEWDDDLHNIVQQMGCFHSQANANSIWLPTENLLTEGFFLQGNAKEEL